MTGQAGTHLLGRVANQIGVHAGLSQVMEGAIRRSSSRDRGTVLTQLAMMVAAGGRCVSDLATLRDQPDLFGDVASDATAWRTINVDIDHDRLDALPAVRQAAVRHLLGQADLDGLGQLELDVDATVLHLDSEGKSTRQRRTRAAGGSPDGVFR